MLQKIPRRGKTRLFLSFLLFLTGMALLFPPHALLHAGEPELYLRITAKSLERGRPLRLGEIADIRGRALLVWDASLVPISPSGEVFTSEELLALMVEAGFGGVLLSLRMPREIPVVPEDEAARLVRRLANWTWRISVEYEGKFPSAALTSPRKIAPGTSQTLLRFQDGTILPIRIRWEQPVCKAQRNLSEGTIIAKNDVCLASAERSGGRIPALPKQALGARVSKNIPQGASIYTMDIDLLPAVTRGQKITLCYTSGGLTVRAAGEALEGGAIGDIISVRNERTRRVVDGKVLAPGIVEVQ
jgi:flagella basal body P-ring formation protein FlgA